jgi:two-component sensor histidine kinase
MQMMQAQNEVAGALCPKESQISNEHLLIRELSHRIGNEYASMIGLASLIALRSDSEKVRAALADFTELLHHNADVHRALQMPACSTTLDASAYIRKLSQSIRLARLDKRGINLVLIDSPIQLRAEQCWKLGMILSELIMNSARHAFGERGGTIQIELSGFGSFAQFSFMDNGSSKNPCNPGQGLRIVDALARELNGDIVRRFGIEGATSILVFPISGQTLQTDGGRGLNAGDATG